MRVHKWFVRGLVMTVLSSMIAGVALYQRWTDPVIVRAQVIQAVEHAFPGADVTVEHASVRLFGGISVSDLRLLRRDDPSRYDFAYVPSAVVYHDKEQLLDGVLAFRKVELMGVRLHVIRREDGTWNFMGLFSEEDTKQPLPTVVVRDGTIILEDRLVQAGQMPIKLTGVELTMINDPVGMLVIDGSGTSSTLGQVNLEATWERNTNRITLALRTVDSKLSKLRASQLLCCCSHDALHELELEATGNANLHLTYDPQQLSPIDYNVQLQVVDGTIQHPKLPLACRKLQADLHCRNGFLQIASMKAQAGTTEIEGHGSADLLCPEENFELAVQLHHLPISDELCQRLPPDIQALQDLFDPHGPVTVQLDLQCQNGLWTRKNCTLHPEEMKVRFVSFPYPINHLRGALAINLLNEHVKVDLWSRSLTEAITVRGVWQGSGPASEVDLKVTAKAVPLDEKLITALPASLQSVARSFHPTGYCDIDARIRRPAGSNDFTNEYHVKFSDASIMWDFFPYKLERVHGRLHIFPDYWTFEDFQGIHGDGQVFVRGRSIAMKSGELANDARIIVEIAGRNIAIDADVRRALEHIPELARAWDTFSPTGRLNFLTKIDQIPGRPQDLEIALDVHGCSIEPTFYRYPLRDLSAQFHYAANRLVMTNMRASHQATRISMDKATIDLGTGGGFYADIENLRGNPVHPDDGFINALPESLRDIFSVFDLKKPVALQARLVVAQSELPGSQPDIYWDGKLSVKDNTLKVGVDVHNVTGTVACVGRYDGYKLLGLQGNVFLGEAKLFDQPFTNVRARLQVRPKAPDVLLVGLHAPLFKGTISGEGRIEFSSTLRYEMYLTASQVDLEEFGRHNLGKKAELSGKASAKFHLQGQGNSPSSLEGNGTIDVPRGKLYNLPFLLNLLKFLGLRWPDRTAFDEAHAAFSIQGTRLAINKLDLWGNAVSLSGQGELNLDGTDLNLEFYPSWARIEQLLPPAVRTVSPAISKNLLKIEVRGKLGPGADDVQFHKRPIPIIVDPIMQLRSRITSIGKAEP